MKEEMNRTIRFLAWKANKWRERGEAKQQRGDIEASYAAGLRAYASRQAAICEGQSRLFQQQWSKVDSMIARSRMECTNPELFYERRKREQTADHEEGEGVGMERSAVETALLGELELSVDVGCPK